MSVEEKEKGKAVERVITLLLEVRDILAASFRSPLLLRELVARLAGDQRKVLGAFSDAFKTTLQNAFGAAQNRGTPPPQQPSTMVDEWWRSFRDAVVGVPDHPNDLETYPAPLVPGLIHGDTTLMEEFLKDNPTVFDFLVDQFEKKADVYEVLSEANMIWIGKHPLDYAALTKESSAWLNLSTTAGSGHKKKDLSTKMKHLLLLNLRLHYEPESWVEVLSVRDRLINVFNRAAKEIPRCSPQVENALRAMDLASPALELIRIDSSPDDVRGILLDRAMAVISTINPAVKEVSKESFITRMSAESRQQRSVSSMLRAVAADIKEEIARIEDHPPSPLSPSPAGSPRPEHEEHMSQSVVVGVKAVAGSNVSRTPDLVVDQSLLSS